MVDEGKRGGRAEKKSAVYLGAVGEKSKEKVYRMLPAHFAE